jgi:hypothetical protein
VRRNGFLKCLRLLGLEENHYLPPKGKDWMDHIRDKGNEANHEIVEMKKEAAEMLISFLEMLLTILCDFPSRVPGKAASGGTRPLRPDAQVQSIKNRRKGALEMWRWHNLWCATVL